MMHKSWKKMTKEEKEDCVRKKLLMGIGIAIFGTLWMYFNSPAMALIVIGLLVFLYGLFLMVRA